MSSGERREELRTHLEAGRARLEATSAKIEARAGRNLFLAVGSGVVFGGLFLVSLFAWQPLFVFFVAALVSVALVELATAFRLGGRRVPRTGAVIGGLMVIAGAAWWGATGMLIGFVLASILLAVWRLIEGIVQRHTVPPKTVLRDVVSGIFSLIYVPFLGAFVILLLTADRGVWWIFALVLVVVLIDVGAYAAGSTLGKHKMTPRISPNKTWEGFGGAAVVGAATGTLIAVLALQQPWWVGTILGLLMLLSATGGDLAESLIKRNLGVKDMSSWIPGHGGFLDRLDSLLPSAVVVYGVALAVGVLSERTVF